MRVGITLIGLMVSVYSSAQVNEYEHYDDHDTTLQVENIRSFFSKGQVHGHVRNSIMSTFNQGELSDYYANATGGSIGFTTARFKGFELGVKGIFTYNTFSSDLNQIDSISGKSAKWEKELFDVTRPTEKTDLDRLEELYLVYHFGQSYLSYGKINLNQGPLLLKRDGRMKPFVYRGFWSEFKKSKKHVFNFGWIGGVSPRGMTEWYSLEEAIGLNNNGFLGDGTKASYHGAAGTKGLGVFGYRFNLNGKVKVRFWDYYLHHMYNTTWLQVDYETKNWFSGAQYVFQFADPYQQRLDYSNRIFQPGTMSNTLSVQLGYKLSNSGVKLSTAYLHGFEGGRFVFPRELTRENFYVSQPRSWIDGFGKVDVYMIRLYIKPNAWKGFSFDTRFERVQSPAATDYENNKYGVSPYYQSTVVAKYAFQKKLTGLNLLFLYVYKYSEDELQLSEASQFYRTNLHHFNLILNVNF